MTDDLARYGPFVLGSLCASILIAKYPGAFRRMPTERLRSMLLTFDAALVLYVFLDLVSGRALTSMTDLPKAALVLLTAVLVIAIANVLYLIVRPRATR